MTSGPFKIETVSPETSVLNSHSTLR